MATSSTSASTCSAAGGARIALLGAGRAASSLARALAGRGYALCALTCATEASARAASAFLGQAPIASSNREAAEAGDILIIGVQDDRIAGLARELAAAGALLAGRTVLHLSGSLDASVLDPLKALGAHPGSLHPCQTFPERIEEPDYLAGTAFAVEGDRAALAVAEELARSVGGLPLRLEPGTKALYHAAASIVSGHTTALLDLALRLLARAGVGERRTALRAMLPLLIGTLGAVETQGAERALTGPVARGDRETLARHLAELTGADRELYETLSRALLRLAARAGRLDVEAARGVAQVLAPRPARVVASLRAQDAAGLEERAARARGADLLEYRLDLLASPGALAALRLEALDLRRGIVTLRPGPLAGPGEARAILAAALEKGARYVDLALEADRPEQGLDPARLILSWHGPPAGAREAARAIAERRPAVGKLVLEAGSPADLLALPEIARTLRSGGGEVAAFASGEAGTASRVLARRLGSDWTYAALERGQETAPGQIPLEELLALYRVRSVGPATAVFGLAGSPLGHSLSPRFMNPLLREIRKDAVYVPLPCREASGLIELVRGLGVEGVSVTMPLKEDAARRADRLGDEARATASVNTLLQHGTSLVGENTDVAGILRVASRLGAPGAGSGAALVLGAGGAARAAALALGRLGVAVTLVGRSPERARAAAALLGCAWSPALPGLLPPLLVNATPVGMAAEPGLPLEESRLREGRVRALIDLVYRPPDGTPLTRLARELGLAVAEGREVLFAQGAEQLRLFTGQAVEPERLADLVAPW